MSTIHPWFTDVRHIYQLSSMPIPYLWWWSRHIPIKIVPKRNDISSIYPSCIHHISITYIYIIHHISGWWYTYPSEKWWSSSVGIDYKIPNIWKVIKFQTFQTFQTINQMRSWHPPVTQKPGTETPSLLASALVAMHVSKSSRPPPIAMGAMETRDSHG